MLFSKNLLSKFILGFDKIEFLSFAKALNSLGMEIEATITHPKNNGLVIGQIIEIKKHPESKNLHICKVKIDENTIKTIVCGASNLKNKKFVIVCLNNSKLFDGTVIYEKNIKNVLSEGMICGYSELTPNNLSILPNEWKDQVILLNNAIIGDKNWEKLIGLDDVIYDISIPNNRNDLNSYLIFCYEIANKLHLKSKLKTNLDLINFQNNYENIFDQKICSSLNFLTYDCKNHDKKMSNWKMMGMLINHQIKPINNLIDKLAYVSLLTNCPTNVYDADKINNKLLVKLITENQNFLAFNESKYFLNKDDICVFDGNKPVAIASIICGNECKLTSNTKKIIIEVGNFNYVNVRNTSLHLNINTSASKQSSKPISNFLNLYTIYLIQKFFGKPLDIIINNKPNWNKNEIKFDSNYFNEFVVEKFDWKTIKNSLKLLGFKFNKKNVIPPLWRLDIQNKFDLVEEILKIIEIDSLKPIEVDDYLTPINENKQYNDILKITNILITNYFNEVKTYNLTNKNNLAKFNLFNLNQPIKILTSNQNRQYLRNNLLNNMLKVYQYNIARKHKLLPIYEIQMIHDNSYEFLNLTTLSTNKIVIDNLSNSLIYVNLNFFKSLILEIATIFNVKLNFICEKNSFFYENEALTIKLNNKTIGYMGKIKKTLLKEYDLYDQQIYAMSININEILTQQNSYFFKLKPLGIYQQINKDINFSIKKNKNLTISNFLIELLKINNIEKYEITNIYHKDDDVIYTIKYFLDDSKKYSLQDLEEIYKQITNLIYI